MSMTRHNPVQPWAVRSSSKDEITRLSCSNATDIASSPPSHQRNEFGIRKTRDKKSPWLEFVLSVTSMARPDVKPSGKARRPAHTVWVSENRLFAISGCHTEVFDTADLLIKYSAFKARLASPDGREIPIKPNGPEWHTFLNQLNHLYPDLKIDDKAWKLSRHSKDTYEYFER